MAHKRHDTSVAIQPLLLTIAETKAVLKIGPTLIYRLMNEGALERRKVGKLTRITFASVKRLAGHAE